MSKRSSKERVTKTRLGRKFNDLLENPQRSVKPDASPIGLCEIYDLVINDAHVVRVRAFACDIIEARIAGGECTPAGVATPLCGIDTLEGTDGMRSYRAVFDDGHSFGYPLRLIENGIMELGFAPWRASTITLQDGVLKSRQAKRVQNHVAILVTSKDPDNPGMVSTKLYYRVSYPLVKFLRPRKPSWFRYSEHDTNPGLSHKDAQTIIGDLSSDTCIHRFEWFSHTGWNTIKEVTELCAFCGERRTRKATNEEQSKNRRANKQLNKIHSVYHRVSKQLEGLDGYEAIEKARRIAKRNKGHVQIVHCDDSAFTTSAILLVDHENDDQYMGTTVIYLPQNQGCREEFFLYPDHRENLEAALDIIRKKTAAHHRNEDA